MYIFIYTYVYVHIYIYIYMYMYIYIYIHMYVYIFYMYLYKFYVISMPRKTNLRINHDHLVKPPIFDHIQYPIGSMVLLYMVTWIPSIYPSHLVKPPIFDHIQYPIGSMYAIYGNIYHPYTPVMLAYIYQHHGSVMGMNIIISYGKSSNRYIIHYHPTISNNIQQ